MVNCGAVEKAAVLKKCAGERSAGDEVGVADEVGALQCESGEGVVVGGLGDGDGHAGLQGEDGVEGPATEEVVCNAG